MKYNFKNLKPNNDFLPDLWYYQLRPITTINYDYSGAVYVVNCCSDKERQNEWQYLITAYGKC